MGLAVALLAQRSLVLELYAATLDGRSINELASEYAVSTEWIQERLTAVRYALKHQVRLELNRGALNGNATALRN
jgi:Mor family transcriptional regulator